MDGKASLLQPLLSPVKSAPKPKKIPRWRLYDCLLACMAMVGLAAALVDYELRYSDLRTHTNCREEEVGETYRWITLVTSLFGAYFLVIRRTAKLEDLHEREQRKLAIGLTPDKIDKCVPTVKLVCELLALLVFPYPYLQGCIQLPQHYRTVLGGTDYADTTVAYTSGEAAYFFMFIRLFFLFRSLFQLVSFQDSFAIEVCEPHHVEANIRFSIKCLFKMYPMTMVVALLAGTVPLIAYLLRLVERPFNDLSAMDLSTYLTSLWCTAVTLATIGYGDYFPHTNLGRLLCALTGAWGAVVFSVIVFVIQDGMDLTKRQHTCFQKVRRLRASARFILSALKYNYARKHRGQYAVLKSDLSRLAKLHRQERIHINRFSFRREEEIIDLSGKVVALQAQVQSLDSKLDLLLAAKTASSTSAGTS